MPSKCGNDKEEKCGYAMDRLQNSILHNPAIREISMFENILDSRINYEFHYESYGKLESGTNSRRTNSSKEESFRENHPAIPMIPLFIF